MESQSVRLRLAYLVREGQAQLDLFAKVSQGTSAQGTELRGVGMRQITCLVGNGLGIASSLQRDTDGCRARPKSCTGDAEGVHDGGLRAQLRVQLLWHRVVVNENCFRPQTRIADMHRPRSRVEKSKRQIILPGRLSNLLLPD